MYKVVSHYQEDPEKIQLLRDKAEKYWTDHFMYTRQGIISVLAGLEDTNSIVARLSSNQDDIGSLLRPFYPDSTINEFVTLLKQHINIATQYINAVKTGISTADIEKAWMDNGEAIVNWKSSVNPWNWPRNKTEPLWTAHMQSTIAEIKARSVRNWIADVAAADAAYDIIRQIAKSYADGIIYQNIESFAKQ